MKKTLFLTTVFVLTLLFESPNTLHAANTGDWDFKLTPLYLWAIQIDGDLAINDVSSQASVNFEDVWENLEGVFTGALNVFYHKKYGILIDYTYLDLGTERVSDRINTNVGFTSEILNLAAIYRFTGGKHVLDGLAGIRYTALEANFRFNLLGTELEGDQDWVDPIIGVRYHTNISEKWSVTLYGDIGGFGVSSDLTWQTFGLAEYGITKNASIVAGYRLLGTDYSTGSGTDRFSYDAIVHGPIVGFNFYF